GGPELDPFGECGGQQVRVDPADPAAMKLSRAHEINHLVVGDSPRLMHLLVEIEKQLTAAAVPDEKLSVDERMARDILTVEESIEGRGVRRSISKRANPDRCVDEDHLRRRVS